MATNHAPKPHPHVLIASDNVPAIAWLHKGSTSSNSASAFLLHNLSQYRRHCPFTYSTIFTPVTTNHIVDCCSRLVNLSETDFLDYMNMSYLVQPYWRLGNPARRCEIERDLCLIKQTATTATTATRTGASDTSWHIWCTFCQDLHMDPYLNQLDDPIPLIQIFVHKYREGSVAPSGAVVRSPTVEGALHAVGQTFTALGSPDPRLQSSGKLDFCLSRQLTAYKKQDPPPTRVKPIPFFLITQTAIMHYTAVTPQDQALADMLMLGFFFLLQPGEYTHTTNPEASPFRLRDTHLLIHNRRIFPYQCTAADLQHMNYIALEFTSQKNGIRGELVGLGRTGHPTWCPVRVLII